MRLGKLIILIALLGVCGCGYKETKITDSLEITDHMNSYMIREFEYDGCQYIAFGAGTGLSVTHKGNCKYCQERHK